MHDRLKGFVTKNSGSEAGKYIHLYPSPLVWRFTVLEEEILKKVI
ncbi:hypothetical protein [Mesotoga sp.]